MTDAPHRACILTAKIEADTREEMVKALMHMADNLARGELTTGSSGSPGAGTIYEYVENAEPSHDDYFVQLRAHLAERKSDSGAVGSVPDLGYARLPVKPTAAMLRPFYDCPPDELELAWQAMMVIATATTKREAR